MYKYRLDTSSKKFICPVCLKRRFVRMKDDAGQYAAAEFGRCDRESSCGYVKWPVNGLNKEVQGIIVTKPPVRPIASLIDYQIFKKSLGQYEINPLYQHLIKYFDEELVLKTFVRYKVGTSKRWGGASVFWQVNVDSSVHAGKIMGYDVSTGKRIKEPFVQINWVHKVLGLEEFNLEQLLMGTHLLKCLPKDQIVCVVESEKTALVLSMILPHYLWVATGSIANLNKRNIGLFRHKKVLLMPDSNAVESWQAKADIFRVDLQMDIEVSKLILKSDFGLDTGSGYDLADVIEGYK